jgi:Zn-dependent peptidase ImmA (M78 family)
MPLDLAAKKLKVDADVLRSWERNGAILRLTEIEELGLAYRRPSAVFFLTRPPAEPPLPTDHRTLPSQNQHHLGPKSILAVRFAQRVQEEAREIARTLGVSLQTRVPRLWAQSDADDAAARLRTALGVDIATQLAWKDDYAALRGWIAAVEGVGVLVLRQPMPVYETRAFSLNDSPPVVVLNSSDGVYPRIFSLGHELAHIALGSGSICDTRLGPYGEASRGVETFCNRVAGAILVPAGALSAHPLVKGVDPDGWDEERLRRIANSFGVSQEVILRRLLIEEMASAGFYRFMRREWSRRPVPPRKPGGGADPVGDCIYEHSRPFVQLVRRLAARGSRLARRPTPWT